MVVNNSDDVVCNLAEDMNGNRRFYGMNYRVDCPKTDHVWPHIVYRVFRLFPYDDAPC